MQCVLTCPTGALSHLIDTKEQSRMGVARKGTLCETQGCLTAAATVPGFRKTLKPGYATDQLQIASCLMRILAMA